MNREPNKEIDILLRKLSGEPNGSFRAADGNFPAGAHEHLDADELNAYAEQALPDSLRARYTEHIADCSRCRNIVTQLSLSTTAIPTREAVAERSPSWLTTFLASLFSPFVIRYAVPAMAVIMIAALAWIVLRREPASDQVAQNTPSSAKQGQIAEQTVSPAPPPSAESSAVTPAKPDTSVEPAREQAANKGEAKTFADNRQPEVSRDEARAEASASKAADDEKKLADVSAKSAEPAPVTVAPAAGAAAPPAPKETVTVVERNEPIQKKSEGVATSVERRAYEERQRSGPSNNQRAKNQEAQPNAAQTQTRGARTMGISPRKDGANEEEAEVRTLGGHRFTKREDVWVDALYDSNRSVVNVSRGSEQYRILMGDEPDLRAIVEKLSGEIIVVWKNKAYRFR